MNIALTLIALGFGYKIFAEASQNTKKQLKTLGRAVGAVMMIASLLTGACAVYCSVRSGDCSWCPMKGGKMMSGKMCPITGKQSPAAES